MMGRLDIRPTAFLYSDWPNFLWSDVKNYFSIISTYYCFKNRPYRSIVFSYVQGLYDLADNHSRFVFFTGQYFFHDITAAILMFPNNKIFSFILLVFLWKHLQYCLGTSTWLPWTSYLVHNVYPILPHVVYVYWRDNLARNPCSPNPCHHDGRCVSHGEAEFECECARGYVGFKCESKLLCLKLSY